MEATLQFASKHGCYIRHISGEFVSVHSQHGKYVPFLTDNPEEASLFFITRNDSGGFQIQHEELISRQDTVKRRTLSHDAKCNCWLSDFTYVWEILPPIKGCLHSILSYQERHWQHRMYKWANHQRILSLEKDANVQYKYNFHRLIVAKDMRSSERNSVWMFTGLNLQDELFLRTFLRHACRLCDVDASDWISKPGGLPTPNLIAQYKTIASNKNFYLYDEFLTDIREGLCWALEFFQAQER